MGKRETFVILSSGKKGLEKIKINEGVAWDRKLDGVYKRGNCIYTRIYQLHGFYICV